VAGSPAHPARRCYFTRIKSFPINIDLRDIDLDHSESIHYKASGQLSCAAGDPTDRQFVVDFAFKRLSSFVYNPRYALEGTIDLRDIDELSCDHLTLRFLPVGCLIASFVHRLPETAHTQDTVSLRLHGQNCYDSDLGLSGLVFDLIANLSQLGAISHCQSLPYDMLDEKEFWQRKPTRRHFCDEMAWRAWACGNFVTLGAEENAYWQRDDAYRTRASLPSPHGHFEILFNNYFGWRLRSSTTANLAGDANLIAHELEPVMYMISRRSQCASGLRNVQDLSRAFVWDHHSGLKITEMRRYVSATRLAMLSPREYEESTDKSCRAIYNIACEDLAVNKRVAEFNGSAPFVL